MKNLYFAIFISLILFARNGTACENEPNFKNSIHTVVAAPTSVVATGAAYAAEGLGYFAIGTVFTAFVCLPTSLVAAGIDGEFGGLFLAECVGYVTPSIAKENTTSDHEFGSYGKAVWKHTEEWRCPL